MGKGFSLEGHLGSNQFFIHSNLKPDPIRHKKNIFSVFDRQEKTQKEDLEISLNE